MGIFILEALVSSLPRWGRVRFFYFPWVRGGWCLQVSIGTPICQNAFFTALNHKMPTPLDMVMST